MRVVKQTVQVELEVSRNELIDGQYVHYECVSAKLKALEEKNNTQYKALRNKFYNSVASGKYNIICIYGLRCIDIKNPMRAKASLEIKFKEVK